MEDSITFSQELPTLAKQKRPFTPESTPLVESAMERDVKTESFEQVRRPTKPLVYGIVATCALGSFLWGYNLSVIAGAMLIIADHFSLSVQWHGFVVSVMIAGAAVGAFTAGVLNDKLGRWMVMMFSAVLFGVGAVVMGLALSRVYLVVGRAIVGVGTGFFTVTGSVYIAELVPSYIRGKLVFLSYVMTGGGVLAGAVIDGLFSLDDEFADKYGWRCMLGFGVIPATLMFLGLWFTPETPRWLVFHNNVDKARKTLKRVRHWSVVEDELAKITQARDKSTQGDSITIIQFIKGVLDNKAVLFAIIVGCSLHILRSLGGAVIVLNYSSSIFNMAGFEQKEAIWLSVVPAFANLTAKFAGSLVIGKMGRRNLYFLSSLGAATFLVVLAITFYANDKDSPPAVSLHDGASCDYSRCGQCVANSNCGFCVVDLGNGKYSNGTCSKGSEKHANFMANKTCGVRLEYEEETDFNITTDWYFDNCPDNKFAPLAIVATFMYVVFFAIGLAPLPWIINSEIYPTWARGNAVAFASMLNWIFSLVVAQTFLPLIDLVGQLYVFLFYATVVFLGFLFMFLFVPDTKGKDLEDTQKLFARVYCLTWCK